ncbi:MAG: RHS repeat protein, partial [Gammaproteobacteria bacterium]|nr:RHS repeat protein [Gammaproteobacteria bacterium]
MFNRSDNATEIYQPRPNALQTAGSVDGIKILQGNTITSGFDASNALTRTDKNQFELDLAQINFIDGGSLSFTYDGISRLATATDSVGQSLQYNYDARNRLSSVQAPSGTIQYGYDIHDNLTLVTYPDGTTKKYLYEDAHFIHALTGIIDQRGVHYATYSYDTAGRAVTSTHAGNADRVDLTYNTNGTTTVTNSRNVNSVYSFTNRFGLNLVSAIAGPGCSSCGSGDSSYQYDPANSNLLSKTVKGQTTTYANYDSKGNPGTVTEAVGTPQ